MEILLNQKQISNVERSEISQQVKAELVEHLYKGCLPGTISGIPVGIAIFIDLFGYTSTHLLIIWTIYYCFALITLTSIYFFHAKHKAKYSDSTWLTMYSVGMSLCAVAWGLTVFLMPDNTTRQYIIFIALLMFATGYATGSIGVFELCFITLTIILTPLIVWSFIKGGFLYNLIAAFSLIYFAFLLSINRRSTEWFKDSLKLKLENNLVSYQANHDLLTDLPNQRLLPQYINDTIGAVKNTQGTFALVSFSLNRMEIINDSLGHQAGNTILKTVAERFNTLAKQSATDMIVTISRADTFKIIIKLNQAADAENQIKNLFNILDEPFYLEKQEIKVTASIGVSIYGKDGDDAKSLVSNADAAMLQAKQFGGNRLVLYRAEINAQLPKQLELENDLHTVLQNHQLQLYYQPLVDVKTGKISGMESLLRWIHPVHGFISPMNFIPLAEETGLIIPIGEWIIEEACKQTKIWHDMGYSTLKVAVNLSAKQLRQENIIAVIERILKDTNFNPKLLELEITETAILDESVIHIIQEFKRMGMDLAVDDFGTGYSGLSYLKRFSIDKLKIDQSFIRDIPGNNDSITIVSAIIAMAKELKVRTLAEGVETIEQLQFLTGKECDYIQGYYFSKPLETKLFTQLLAEGNGFAKPANK
jgi:diguanylate cyclase (GGDEF)-like protein